MIKYIKYIKKAVISQLVIKLLCLFFVVFIMGEFANLVFAKQIRRDPFVSLVDKDGNIRKGQDLFVEAKEILPDIILKGILWDEKSPLAVSGLSVVSGGPAILFLGISLPSMIALSE